MKFGKKINFGENIVKEYFAWLPVTIDGETRWLERVKIEGIYKRGNFSLSIYFLRLRFLN